MLATKLGDGLGQPAVVDNRPGAGANTAAELVSKAPPDGYTVLLANAGIATGAYLRSKTDKYAKVVKAIGLRIQ